MATLFDTKKNTIATSLTEVLRDPSIKRNGYEVAKVTVTKKVTVQAYWNTDATTTKFDPKAKYSVQDVWKLSPGKKFLAVVSTVGDIDPKKNALYVYDPEATRTNGKGAWAKIPGGYAKKLVSASDIEKTLYSKILDSKKVDIKKQLEKADKDLNKVLADIDKLFNDFGKEVTKKVFTRYTVSYGSAYAETESFRDTPTLTLYIRTDHNPYSSNNDAYIELNISSGGYKLTGTDIVDKHIEELQYVKKLSNVWDTKFKPGILELQADKKRLSRAISELNRQLKKV